jgi:hypothetical protein
VIILTKLNYSIRLSDKLDKLISIKGEIEGNSKSQVIQNILNLYFETHLLNEYLEEIKKVKE